MGRPKIDRTGEESFNNDGCLMRIIKYTSRLDIIVEFQDEYKSTVHTTYQNYKLGNVKNPYYPSVFGIGIVGNKYSPYIVGEKTIVKKEYRAWKHMLTRCFDKEYKYNEKSYADVTCCSDWLFYENFCDWLYSQHNFNQWLNNERWCIDKDILLKNNKIYAPDKCCLVPMYINNLFIKGKSNRGDLPVGVSKSGKKFRAACTNPFNNKTVHLGNYDSPEEAFNAYKKYKENLIKQVAQIEFDIGNITEECYNAMLRYEVDITD